ncbi:uncharacterized protein LOC109713632 isoform X2 [Ananas comosus]|uniref:Uncharacterized protein LOC109713632 isoform X2 n=1 Tax=Ananas comosus TaxID=4615 RepID=A0A6P5FIX7_ANACO|nr:uncharacterized protein LOC109713632 isoform X2 [Ananas comosus]
MEGTHDSSPPVSSSPVSFSSFLVIVVRQSYTSIRISADNEGHRPCTALSRRWSAEDEKPSPFPAACFSPSRPPLPSSLLETCPSWHLGPLFQPGDASWGGSGNIGRPTECGVCWWCTRTARAGEARPLVAP